MKRRLCKVKAKLSKQELRVSIRPNENKHKRYCLGKFFMFNQKVLLFIFICVWGFIVSIQTLSELPRFSEIDLSKVEAKLDEIMLKNRAKVAELSKIEAPTWDNFLQPLNLLNLELDRVWGPINHLQAVASTDELREVYSRCLPKLSEYSIFIAHNKRLYELLVKLRDSAEFDRLNKVQQRIVTEGIKGFKLAGVALPEQQKAELSEINKKLSILSNKFSEQVMYATDNWSLHITDEAKLKGVPARNKQLFQQAAKDKGLSGWLIGLDAPSYIAIVTHAEDRELRQQLYRAYAVRASEFDKAEYDNTQNIKDILELRLKEANLLGFNNFAELSLETKMAKTTQQVLSFLSDLAKKAKPKAMEDIKELEDYAQSKGLDKLELWDISYYSDKLSAEKYAVSQEELREYFPVDKVLQGLFTVVNRLYGITVKEIKHGIDVWHPSVRFFEIYDKDNKIRGKFYLDLFARKNKRSGAWMDNCIDRVKQDEKIITPVAYLVMNFSPPTENKSSYLSLDEVRTLFHEFGHGLQHMLTKVDYLQFSGINGVPWDAVEFPSQFLENWCGQKEVLQFLSEHSKTGKPVSDELVSKLKVADKFQAGNYLLRQLCYALFDFTLHTQYTVENKVDVLAVAEAVNKEFAVLKPAPYSRMPNSFSHIFAGGYAAGYYSYLWAEVLAADAFSRFEEEGIFNQTTGLSFMQNILETGGSEDPEVLFKKFRGRAQSITPLLKQKGV